MEGEGVYHLHLMLNKPSICIIRKEDKSDEESNWYISEELKEYPSWFKIRRVKKRILKEIDSLIGKNVIFYVGGDHEFDVFHKREGSKIKVHKRVDDCCISEESFQEISGKKYFPFEEEYAEYVKGFFKNELKNPDIKE